MPSASEALERQHAAESGSCCLEGNTIAAESGDVLPGTHKGVKAVACYATAAQPDAQDACTKRLAEHGSVENSDGKNRAAASVSPEVETK